MAAATARPVSSVGRIEGAFNRCIMRLAQALKDPSTYGDSTKPFIQECALQFHDALDDCEVQILNAKWYLEHQLAQNKARRETRAREAGLAAQKRKLDQMQGRSEAEAREDDVKRVKLEAPRENRAEEKVAEPQPETNEVPTTAPRPDKSEREDVPPKPADEPSHPEPEQPGTPSKSPVEAAKQASKPTAQGAARSSPQALSAAPAAADQPAPAATGAQTTPQVTPALTSDEFSFVSMFQDPSQDVANLDVTNNDDLNLNLDLGDDFVSTVNDGGGRNAEDAGQGAALDGLLPGLENYVNQDEAGGDAGGGLDGGVDNPGALNSNANADQDMSFDLPPLDGPNEFDALFSEHGFDGMATASGALDMDPDGSLSHEALNMENLDLDSMFNY
ncbi:hypothetical protein DV737_g690, partial [Chaetothyriales sp. CBS 132003]